MTIKCCRCRGCGRYCRFSSRDLRKIKANLVVIESNIQTHSQDIPWRTTVLVVTAAAAAAAAAADLDDGVVLRSNATRFKAVIMEAAGDGNNDID